MESIVIPKSVIEIDERTFVSCDALVSITVEEGNPVYHSSGNCIIETATKTLMIGFDNSVIPTDGSVTNIGKRAFWGRAALIDITIPDSVTSIGAWAFSGCSSLKSITFGSGIASIGEAAFFRCDDLEDVYVTDLEAWLNIVFILPDNYELMESESHGTHQPNGRANLHFLDENGNEMTSIVIPESVTSIREGAFAACRSLTSITIGNHVTSIGDGAFSGCSSLSNVEIPNSVTIIDKSAFYRCSSLSSIVIPDSVTSIGWRAFANCESVTSVTIGKGVTVIYSDAFRNCSNIKDVYIKDVVAWANISFGGLYYAHPNWYGTLHILDDNGKEVTDLVIPEGVTSISDDLFHRCEALTSVVIPDSVTHIGESAFAYCSSLKSITFGNGVKSVDESAFYGCDDAIYTEYKSVKYVGDAQNPYVILIGAIDRKLSTYEIHPDTKVIAARAFAVCNNMTSITIPEGVVGIGEFAFRECVLLTSVVIPDSVVRIFGYTFSHCTALKNVTFENPNGWEGRIGEPNVNGNVYYYVEFAADELSNSKTAMQYLTSDYSQYRWDRTEPENPPCETHSYYLQNWAGVAQKAWGICTVCGYIDENHEHIIKDGKCQYCDFVLTTTEVSSVFDNDGDGQNEVYLFAAALPEKFAADGVIHVDAVEDNLSDNIPRREYSEYTSILYRVPYDHVYLEKGQDQYLLYTITVEEAGVYEVAIHLRLKDCMTRGATYIINEGTENEYSFQTSYGWETVYDAIEVRNNDKLIGTYMFGIYVELQAGENTIKITETELARTQHFRDFYFLKVENPPCENHKFQSEKVEGLGQKAWGICTVCGYAYEYHEHIIKDGKCQYCDYVLTTTEVSSVFDNDGDGQNEVYLFAPALPEKFTADGAIYVDAVNDNLSDQYHLFDPNKIGYSPPPYYHVYYEKGKNEYLLYTITVEEAGVYEMAIHRYLKDIVTRGATYIINEGTENEYVFQTSYGWETTDEGIVVRNNDKLKGTYMFGIYVELQAGENTIKIVETELYKTQHFRDFYFVKVEE